MLTIHNLIRIAQVPVAVDPQDTQSKRGPAHFDEVAFHRNRSVTSVCDLYRVQLARRGHASNKAMVERARRRSAAGCS
jgi:hypothetical protein